MFGGHAALAGRRWLFTAIFLTWEMGYWVVKQNFIPFFHVAGFFSGVGLMSWYLAHRSAGHTR